jgi:hypothetical protein
MEVYSKQACISEALSFDRLRMSGIICRRERQRLIPAYELCNAIRMLSLAEAQSTQRFFVVYAQERL